MHLARVGSHNRNAGEVKSIIIDAGEKRRAAPVLYSGSRNSNNNYHRAGSHVHQRIRPDLQPHPRLDNLLRIVI